MKLFCSQDDGKSVEKTFYTKRSRLKNNTVITKSDRVIYANRQAVITNLIGSFRHEIYNV